MSSITKDLRKKTNEELTDIISKLKTQLLEIRFSVSNGETEKLANASEIRKTIARALTINNEREFLKNEKNSSVLENTLEKTKVVKKETKEVKKNTNLKTKDELKDKSNKDGNK